MWSETDLAYLAGLIDGEGHITIRKRPRGDKFTFDTILRVSGTSHQLMKWVLKTFGGTWGVAVPKGNRRVAYIVSWSASYAEDFALAKQVFPYLKLKKRQLELYIMYHEFKGPRKTKRPLAIKWAEECYDLNHMICETEICEEPILIQ